MRWDTTLQECQPCDKRYAIPGFPTVIADHTNSSQDTDKRLAPESADPQCGPKLLALYGTIGI